MGEAEQILEGMKHSQIGCFFNCKCPNLKIRYSLSKKATTISAEIAALQDNGEFSRFGYPAPRGQMPFTSVLVLPGFESRLSIEQKIIGFLKDDSFSTISLCGMGGVGKTTLVEKIGDKVREDKLFDEVVMAVVSRDQDPAHIQLQLAENLGLKFEVNTLHARAERLYTRLMDQEKSILLILDDIWNEIEMHEIGIPNKDARKGLKVILTLRFMRVCTMMSLEEIIEVEILSEEEAWDLFKSSAGMSESVSDTISSIAKEVAKECQGLPLAIVIVGKTLKNIIDLAGWREALQQMKCAEATDGIRNGVYSKIKWSLDYLESEKSKSLLLLCSLFPEDYRIPIKDLVRYCKGLQLFVSIDTMMETRDKVDSIINELQDCYLMQKSGSYHVKLHDVIRDACLSFTSNDETASMVSLARLKEWPLKASYGAYNAISLSFDELDELPGGLCCLNLMLLRLAYTQWFSPQSIKGNGFLQAMDNLRVLDFVSFSFELVPFSLQSSTNLRTLNFYNCELHDDLSVISSLRMIKVLSFYECVYKGPFPNSIAELTNLKSLDLRFEDNHFGPLPSGILLQLKKLEEVYLGLLVITESIGEITSLSSLNTIQVHMHDGDGLQQLLQSLDVEKIIHFHIAAGPDESFSPYQFSSILRLNQINVDLTLEPKMKVLLRRSAEHMWLHEIKGLSAFVNDFLDKEINFSNLESLEIDNCDMKYLYNAASNFLTPTTAFFDKLEKLNIQAASNLEELCHGSLPPMAFAKLQYVTLNVVPLLSCLWCPIPSPCLGNLRELRIEGAKVITSIFLGCSVKCLDQLQTIRIYNCPKLEMVVSTDSQEGDFTTEGNIEFPQVQNITIFGAHNFQRFYSDSEDNEIKLNSMELHFHILPKLKYVNIDGSERLQNIGDAVGQNTSKLLVSNCCALHLGFDFARWIKAPTEECEERIFDQLEDLELTDLPLLRSLWRNLPEGSLAFQHLTTLVVSNCKSLKHLLTPLMAKMMVSLENLKVSACDQMEEIIGNEGIYVQDATEHISDQEFHAFQNLKELEVTHCDTMRYLFTPQAVRMLVSLERLALHSCKNMEELIRSEGSDILEKTQGPPSLGNLKFLTVNACGSLKYLLSSAVIKTAISLEELEVLNCPQMEELSISVGTDIMEGMQGPLVFPVLKKMIVQIFCLEDLLTLLMNMHVSVDKLEVSDHINLKQILCGRGKYAAGEIQMAPKETCFFRNLKELTIRGWVGLKILLTPTELKMLALLEKLVVSEFVEPLAFPNLKELKVMKCNSLKHLFTHPVTKMFGSLQKLHVSDCEQMESIIKVKDKELVEGREELVFPNLDSITIYGVFRLKMLYAHSQDLELPSLTQFRFRYSPHVGNLLSQLLGSKTPVLKEVEYSEPDVVCSKFDLDLVKMWLQDYEAGTLCLFYAFSGQKIHVWPKLADGLQYTGDNSARERETSCSSSGCANNQLVLADNSLNRQDSDELLNERTCSNAEFESGSSSSCRNDSPVLFQPDRCLLTLPFFPEEPDLYSISTLGRSISTPDEIEIRGCGKSLPYSDTVI